MKRAGEKNSSPTANYVNLRFISINSKLSCSDSIHSSGYIKKLVATLKPDAAVAVAANEGNSLSISRAAVQSAL